MVSGMGIDLDPSANYASPAVLNALGRLWDDEILNVAVERAKRLFGADHVNIRCHSAGQANMAAYSAILELGDSILGVNIGCESFLSQDNLDNKSARDFDFIGYRVEEKTGKINYENVFGLAFKHKPKLIMVETGFYSRKIDFVQLQEVAEEVGARLMVDMSHIAGLVAAGLHQNPVPYADFVIATTDKTLRGPGGGVVMCKAKFAAAIDNAVFESAKDDHMPLEISAQAVAFNEAFSEEFKVYQEQTLKNARAFAAGLTRNNINLVSGGTDTQVILVDLRNQGLTGQEAEKLLGEIGVIVVKSFIPNDSFSTGAASGIIIGTPAVTSRGMKEDAMGKIADIISMVLSCPKDDIFLANAGKLADDLCGQYPLCQTE